MYNPKVNTEQKEKPVLPTTLYGQISIHLSTYFLLFFLHLLTSLSTYLLTWSALS